MSKGAPRVGDIIDFQGVRIVGEKEHIIFPACSAGAGKSDLTSSSDSPFELGINVRKALTSIPRLGAKVSQELLFASSKCSHPRTRSSDAPELDHLTRVP